MAFALLLASPFAAESPRPSADLKDALNEVSKFRVMESLRHAHRIQEISRSEGNGVQPGQNLDVQHAELDLRVDPAAKTVAGTVTLTFVATQTLSQVRMRLAPNFKVDATLADGVSKKVRRSKWNIVFPFNPPLAAGSPHTVAVQYSGSPKVYGALDGGMMFTSHGSGVPCATTLSEPFASAAWWPCVEDVTDKFTCDIRLTVPEGMVGASNGKLVAQERSTSGPVFRWRENYPLPNYLVAVNVTDYVTFEQSYTSLDGATVMPLQHFVYPESLHEAQRHFQRVPAMVRYYAGLCGEYPFLDEKYGMVAFPWGGGMEHQTLTSMGDMLMTGDHTYDMIYAHELAHQWWGDEVTCGTWNDIWLNEGFATYFEALWAVHAYGYSEGDIFSQGYDDGQYNGYLGGSVYVKNGDAPFADTGAIYEKGGWVLHMLRKVMGEEPFFRALRNYRAAHAFGNAVTADLRAATEAEHGSSLKWFFDQWVYTPRRPIYSVSFAPGSGTVAVTITQKQKHKVANRTADRDVYIMPVDLLLSYEDGTRETVTVFNERRAQTFNLTVPKRVSSVALDPDHWILKVVQ
jgi:aminopeptidase N